MNRLIDWLIDWFSYLLVHWLVNRCRCVRRRFTRSTTWRFTCTRTRIVSRLRATLAVKDSAETLTWKNMLANCTTARLHHPRRHQHPPRPLHRSWGAAAPHQTSSWYPSRTPRTRTGFLLAGFTRSRGRLCRLGDPEVIWGRAGEPQCWRGHCLRHRRGRGLSPRLSCSTVWWWRRQPDDNCSIASRRPLDEKAYDDDVTVMTEWFRCCFFYKYSTKPSCAICYCFISFFSELSFSVVCAYVTVSSPIFSSFLIFAKGQSQREFGNKPEASSVKK